MIGQADPDLTRGIDEIARLLIELIAEQKETNRLLNRVGATIAKGQKNV